MLRNKFQTKITEEMKSIYLDKAVEIIYSTLQEIIPVNDYSELSARKSENEKHTQTIFRTFEAEKVSRIAIEQYTVNSKAYGVVLNIYPKPEYDLPIFTFQLGGQIPDRVIFVLDIIPLLKKENDSKITEIFNNHSKDIQNSEKAPEWINQICTKNAFVCQYKPYNPETVIEALEDYLKYWKSIYLKAEPTTDGKEKEIITENILRFKKILHSNDAGLDIYLRKFGKETFSAIENMAFGSHPALKQKSNEATENTNQSEQEEKNESEIHWTKEAEQYILDAPIFVRAKIKKNAEEKAKELGLKEITKELIENLRK